jgi:hypothetical protein
MNTDDADPGNPSSLSEPQRGGQPEDLLPGQPEDYKPELDAYGLPVQDRRTTGLIYLGVTGCLICAVVSAWLPIMALKYHSSRNVPGWLAWLDVGAAALACGLAWMSLDGAKKKKYQLGVVSRSILVAGFIVGAISIAIMLGGGYRRPDQLLLTCAAVGPPVAATSFCKQVSQHGMVGLISGLLGSAGRDGRCGTGRAAPG